MQKRKNSTDVIVSYCSQASMLEMAKTDRNPWGFIISQNWVLYCVLP